MTKRPTRVAPAEPRLHGRFVRTNGISLHVVEAGPRGGPLVVLLHGFPEFWYGWRHQVPALAKAGFRVLAPDQRGYGSSDKPPGVAAYGLDLLARDVLGLLDEAGRERAFVAGHDWGGEVAWWLALVHPERVERLAILNAPHPAVMRRHLLTSPRQLLRSWYMLAFQAPGLAERALARDGHAPLARAVRGGRRGTCTARDLARYRAAWAEPGALTAMLSWYRAAFRRAWRPLPALRVRVETLVLWGARDRFLGRELAAPSVGLCDSARLVVYEHATHWVQHDEADAVNAQLVHLVRHGLPRAEASGYFSSSGGTSSGGTQSGRISSSMPSSISRRRSPSKPRRSGGLSSR
jgi:pimeloyl-ACP methyl ester carboxylesterase